MTITYDASSDLSKSHMTRRKYHEGHVLTFDVISQTFSSSSWILCNGAKNCNVSRSSRHFEIQGASTTLQAVKYAGPTDATIKI